jgi:hypothetical protein
MGSNGDVHAAPSHHEHHGKRDCGDDGPRQLSESTRRGAKHGTNNDDVGDKTRENGSPKEQLDKEGWHDCRIMERGT